MTSWWSHESCSSQTAPTFGRLSLKLWERCIVCVCISSDPVSAVCTTQWTPGTLVYLYHMIASSNTIPAYIFYDIIVAVTECNVCKYVVLYDVCVHKHGRWLQPREAQLPSYIMPCPPHPFLFFRRQRTYSVLSVIESTNSHTTSPFMCQPTPRTG